MIIIINMKQEKFSKQRDMIRGYLRGNTAHPTADEVYLAMRQQDPTISLGTVYRNLNQLAENGEVRRITVGDGKDRFDFNRKMHGHFICRTCGSVQDVWPDEAFLVKAAEDVDGRVEQEELIFYGTCSRCLQQGCGE